MTQKRTSGSRVFGWWLIGMVLTAAPIAGALCAAQSIQEYKGLALAPDGKRLAVVDPGTAIEAEPHGSVVIRDAEDGHILSRIAPCQCEFSGLAWSPDGTQLAFLVGDETTKTMRLEVATVAARSSQRSRENIETLATVSGLASTPRWAPGGLQIALLVTLDAKKGSSHFPCNDIR